MLYPFTAMFRHALTALVVAACLGAVLTAAQQPVEPSCRVSGVARGAGVVLPGVSISVLAGESVRSASATQADGTYRLSLAPGTYRLRADLTGFDRVERELVVAPPPACDQTIELALTLTPRRAAAPAPAAGRAAAGGRAAGAGGRAGGAPGQGFQRLDVQQDETATAVEPEAAPQEALLLPPGFSGADIAGDAIAVNGAAARVDNGLLNDRARGDFQFPAGAEGLGAFGGFGQPPGDGGGGPGAGPAGQGAPGAGGGRGGGGARGGGPGGGRGGALGGRGFRQNRLNATADYTFGGSALDATPYQLRPDSPVTEKPYTQQNFGTTLGGRLYIPGLITGTRTTFTFSYTGGRGATLFDQYATVPTPDMRAGNFAGLTGTLIDPATGQPFAGNVVPPDRISAQAQALLPYIPLPNLPGTQRNYHYTTTTQSRNDSFNARVTHVFGGAANTRGGGPGGRGGGGGLRGRGAGAAGRGTGASLNVQLQYRHSDADQANTFATLGGTRIQTTIGVPVGLNITKGRQLHTVNINFSHTSSNSTNRFAGVENIAANAGIAGTATDPFSWGVPALSFSSITGLRDVTPTDRSDRRFSAEYSWTHPLRRHQLRLGGTFQADRTSSFTETNANGSFIFTGLYTSAGVPLRGADVADFLLGMPQQASVQYGPGTVTLKGKSLAGYVNDDWRLNGRVTVQLGLRYELLWPFIEGSGHLVNLDVTPDFTAAAPVEADRTGPYTGQFPASLLETDSNNLAPRLGIAWRLGRATVVRGGFGTSYNNGTYSAIARQLAVQPPFATSNTNIGTLSSALLMENALTGVTADETTNTFGIDKDYVLGRVNTYNVDVNHQLRTAWAVGANYTYTRGSSLDVIRAPNRGPAGLRIEGVQPFLWETSEGSSILHSATFRVQRRQVRGLGGGVQYTLARSRDNAPSIGGGGPTSSAVVAQNDQDLNAEWALSSFDRRQRLNANINYDLPFGPNRRWLNTGGALASWFEGWRVTGTLLLDAGTPLTARVQGATRDVAQGVNGALRADYNGQDIGVAEPSINQFFNTGAFSIPLTGQFGDSARNIIIGPGSKQLNAQLSRDIRLGGTRALSLQMRVNNLLNNINYAAIDTNVNSPTFGQVLSVRPMRSAQLNLRFRF